MRQLILPDMPPQEKLFYYQKAAALYETVLDGRYVGFYDPPLLYDYYEIAVAYIKLGELDIASNYINRILNALEKHVTNAPKETQSKLLYSTVLPNAVPIEQICIKLLKDMLKRTSLEPFQKEISDRLDRFYQCSHAIQGGG